MAVTAPTTIETNKALVRSFIEEIFERGNLSAIDDYVGMPSMAAILRHDIPSMRSAISGIRCPIGAMVAEEDTVALEFTILGEHTGDGMGAPPTGNDIVVSNLCIFRIAGGKIVGASFLADRLGLLQQLGIERVPPLAPCPVA